MTTLPQKPVLDPSTTTILVTGSSGYIASHVVEQALELGYTVRGTCRTEEKANNTKKLYGNNPRYSTVIVPDFSEATPENLDEAVKGVDAIVHVASDTSFSNDPKKVVNGVVNIVTHVLAAASREPKVKRFVLTSSSCAAGLPKPGVKMTWTKDTWNDEAVELAWGKDPEPFPVYAASKTEGERALWKFMKEQKPHFVANAVLPNFNMGRIIGRSGPTGGEMVEFYKHQKRQFPPQYFIDVVDDARLHLIPAVLDGSLTDERIFAFATPFNWNDVSDAIVKARPDKASLFKKDPDEKQDLSIVPNELGAELLKKWFGQDGYTSLDDSVKANIEGLE